MQDIDFDKLKLGMVESSYPYVVDGYGFKTKEDAKNNVNGTKIELPKIKKSEQEK